jgi:tetratricopeptide (TPR) repeat protein
MRKQKILAITPMLTITGLADVDAVHLAQAAQVVKSSAKEDDTVFQNFTSTSVYDFSSVVFTAGLLFAFSSTAYILLCRGLHLGNVSSRPINSYQKITVKKQSSEPRQIRRENSTSTSKQITSATYIEKAYTSLRQGDAQRAIAELNNAIRAYPRDAHLYTERANFRRKNLGDRQGALEDYTQAISLRPDNAIYYLWRSQLYHEIGDIFKAMADYNTAIRLAPEDTMYHVIKKG